MASIQSIHDVLKTYQQAYGAEALQAQLALFLKSASSPAPAAKPSVEKSDAPLEKLTGQQLRDIWAELTGRKAGLKSSGKFSKKADLIAEIERLRSAPAASSAASVVSSEEPAAAEEKPKSKRSGPSAWNAFIESVAGKKGSPTAAFLAWKETQTEKKGNMAFSFASSLGKAAFEEFKSTYVPSSSASVASDDQASSAPSVASSEKKRGRPKMSEEEKAAAKEAKKAAKLAEREAKKEEKKAAKKAERAAKKAAKKGETLPPLPESDDEEEPVYTEVEIADQTFFWDENTGILFDRQEDGSFQAVGNYDGVTMSFA